MSLEAKPTVAVLIILVLTLILLMMVYGKSNGLEAYSAPRQPIDFFHRVHAGDKGISCEFCHRTVRTSAFAGMPETELCMRCHRVIIPQHWEIQRLHGYWNRHEPVPWVRVNRLPGFVFFDHHAHVTHGVQCAVCHGSVVEMDRLHQTAPLSMGWCVACHRSHNAPSDCWTCHR